MANFTYDKNKRTWFRSDGSRVLNGNRIYSNGIYYQLNSDGTKSRVGTKAGGLDQSYIDWKKKHGQKINTDLENNAMKTGLIKDKIGKWRLNDEDRSTKTKIVNGKTYFASKDGVWRNFDNGLKISQQNKLDQTQQDKAVNKRLYGNKDESLGEKIKNHGIVEGLLDTGLDALHVSKDSGWRTAAGLGSMALYTLPFVGTALSIGDAGLAAARGDWAGAAMNLGMGLIPMTRGLKSLKTVNKALGKTSPGLWNRMTSAVMRRPAISKSEKMVRSLNEINPAVNDVKSAQSFLATNGNPFSKVNILGFNHRVGNKTARAIEIATSPKTQLGLMAASMAHDLNKYSNAYNSQQQEDAENQLKYIQDIAKNGLILGRVNNKDYNQLFSDNPIDENTYNLYRKAINDNI